MNIKMINFKGYTVFENGDILSLKGKKMRPGKDGRGYHFIFIHSGGERKVKKIHRIVAECFLPNPENKPQVNHIDGNKNNNSIENLEWVTQSENMKHAFRSGLCENTLTAAKQKGKRSGLSSIAKAIQATRKPVINTITGKVYSSVKDAANNMGYKYDTLRHQLNGVNKNKTPLKYFSLLKYEY